MRVSNNLSICGLLLLLTGFCKYTQTHTRKEFSTQQTMPSGHRHTHTRSPIAMPQIKNHAASHAFFFELELVSTAAGRLRLRTGATQWDTATYLLLFNCYR